MLSDNLDFPGLAWQFACPCGENEVFAVDELCRSCQIDQLHADELQRLRAEALDKADAVLLIGGERIPVQEDEKRWDVIGPTPDCPACGEPLAQLHYIWHRYGPDGVRAGSCRECTEEFAIVPSGRRR